MLHVVYKISVVWETEPNFLLLFLALLLLQCDTFSSLKNRCNWSMYVSDNLGKISKKTFNDNQVVMNE